jgi:hypothetical protein
MERGPTTLVVAPLEEREVRHPQKVPLAGRREVEPLRELEPERAERLRSDTCFVRDEQQQVTGACAERTADRRNLLRLEELRNGRAPTDALVAFLDIRPDEPAGALALRKLDQPVELRAGQLA